MSDEGCGVENVVCYNDHGDAGQVMESRRLGGYECPKCGRVASTGITWHDRGDDAW